MGQLGSSQGPRDVRALIHRVEREAKREAVQQLDPGRSRHRGQPRIRDVLGQPDIDVQRQRRSNLILEELPEATMLWVKTAQQLTLIEPERDAVIGLPCAR